MITSLCKYVFNCIDLASEHPWERKSMYIFYLELVMGVCLTSDLTSPHA